MNNDLKQRLMDDTDRAWSHSAPGEAVNRLNAGDLIAIPESCQEIGMDVEWAVLDLVGDRALIVPADTWSETGTADIEVPEEADVGPLSLRCGLALWAATAFLQTGDRLGHLASDDLKRARERVAHLEQGRVEATDAQRRVDDDYTYREFIAEVPAAARQRLRARLDAKVDATSSHSTEGQASVGPIVEFTPRTAASSAKPNRTWRYGLAWAASVLMAVLLAISGGLNWRTQQRVEDLETRLGALASEPLANPTHVVLRRVRGARVLALPADSEAVVLTFDVLDVRVDRSYCATAWIGEPLQQIWKRDGLRLMSEEDLLAITLPRGALPQGEMLVRLEVSDSEDEEPLGEFWISIEYKQQEASP